MQNYFLLIFTILAISMASQTENYKKYSENLPFDMPKIKVLTFPIKSKFIYLL